jgi:serine/threonine protein kinase
VTRTLERPLGERYALADRIATGGMAEVFDATDTRLGRPVAVKVLRETIADQPEMRNRMLAETRLAARLHHPNVVEVLDVGVEDGHPFLVMERLHGSTLRDHLARRVRLEPDAATDIARQVLAALAAAHRLGIVHRDIKPGNILRAPGRVWKVADFGIATSLNSDTLSRTGEILGSPAYLAPERLAGRRATAAADIYAVGVVLYEMLAGRRPFPGDDALEVAGAIREGRHAPLGEVRPGLPRELVAAVERGMAVDPSDRFDTSDAFSSAIEQAQAQGSPLATTATVQPLEATHPLPAGHGTAGPGPLSVPLRPDRRSPIPLAGWLVILATVLVFGAATLLLVRATDSTSLPARHPPAASPAARPPSPSLMPAPTQADGGHGPGDGHGHSGDKPGKGPKDH